MNPLYTAMLHDLQGKPILDLTGFISFEATAASNDVGALKMVVPASRLDPTLSRRTLADRMLTEELIDRWITVYRWLGNSGKLLFGTAWIIRDPIKKRDTGGSIIYELNAFSAADILRSRWVWYATDISGGFVLNFPADDVMKQVVSQNFVAATLPERDIASTYFGIQGNLSLGPLINAYYAYKDVLDAMKEIAGMAYSHPTTPMALYFDVVATKTNPLQLEFQTFTNQRGLDRTAGKGKVEFGANNGSLSGEAYEADYREEINAVLVVAQGEGTPANTYTTSDPSRATRGPFSRRELIVQAGEIPTTNGTGLDGIAAMALATGKQKRSLQATALDVAGNRFQVDWDWGDKVTASFDNQIFDCWIDNVNVKMDNGVESITVKLTDQQLGGGSIVF